MPLLVSVSILIPFHLGPVPPLLHPTVGHICDWMHRKAVEGWGTSSLLTLPLHLPGSLPGQLADFPESGEMSVLHPGPWGLVFGNILGSLLIIFSYELGFSSKACILCSVFWWSVAELFLIKWPFVILSPGPETITLSKFVYYKLNIFSTGFLVNL